MIAPNQLTLARVVMTFVFVIVLMLEIPFAKTMALALFIVASITDLYDGILARRYNIITNFGTLMDPVADKILICSVFVAFVGLHIIPAWMAIVIIAREFVITGLRLLAASKGQVLAAGWGGKNKTVSQVVAASVVLTGLALRDDWAAKFHLKPEWMGTPFNKVAFGFTLVAVIFTLSSAWSYLRSNRNLYMNDM
ncbi:MAG: CDP-diacylglycerol--glycerol-3-phosphate 3-phosphatidyltransferase [Verrucomicrobiae bacterium]|nr:CDP-diacylglycerol--glycerol-3-phosphate 3-phosphatidyltransferase [Verrucomicrobiae bacterium]